MAALCCVLWRVLLGIGIMLAGLTLHLAMVADLIGPSLALSLLGYAGLFTGMFTTVAGVTRIPGRRGAR